MHTAPILNGKVVVVIGGAGLLGRRFVEAVADHGGTPIIADRALDAATDLRQALAERLGCDALVVPVDITSRESLRGCIADVRARHGRIDAVVNSAYPRNANYGRVLEEITYDDFCENVGLHLGGYFLCAQQFAGFFSEQGHGNIVNLASIYGVVAPRFEIYAGTTMTMPAEYAAVKSGIVHLTRYFARYYRGSGVRVNSISPGGIRDRQPATFQENYGKHTASGGLLEATDLTGTLVYLLSDFSTRVTGQNLVVDDGWTL